MEKNLFLCLQWCLLLFCVLLSRDGVADTLNAQEVSYTIQGKVLEKGSRRPISGANVFVVENDSLYAVTDNRGAFSIEVAQPGTYTLSAAAMDFAKPRPRTVNIKSGQKPPARITFYLMPNALTPIVIEGQRTEDRVGKTVISGQELEQVAGGGSDPLKAVQSLPGVTTANDASSEPAVRGSRPGDNGYYIDDVEVGYLYHLGGLVSVVPADIVSDFNLYASAFGPQYDDNLGAIFDVGLRNPRTDRLGGKANVSLLYSEFLAEGPVNDKQSFFISARRSYFELLAKEFNNDKEGVSFVVPNYYDYFGKYVWDVNENNRVKFYLNGAGDEVKFSISQDSDTAQNEPVLAGHSFFDGDYHNQSLVWDSQAGKQKNSLIIGHRTNSEKSKVGTAYNIEVLRDQTFIRDVFHYRQFDHHDIALGGGFHNYIVDVNAEGVNPNCTPLNPENCNDLSGAERVSFNDTLHAKFINGFIKDRWRLFDQVVWITGVRYSQEDYLDEQYLEPRLGLEWELSKRTLFTAGWGKYHQFPDTRYVLEGVGNPNLNQLKSDHWVAGISSQLNKKWFVKSDLYYKTFKDLVVSDETQRYINGGSGDAYGIEFFLKREPVDKLSGWLSLTLSESQRKIDSTGATFPFDYDQPVILTWVGNYRISPKYHFGLKWNYHSGSPYTPIVGSTLTDDGRHIPVLGATNSSRIAAYHRLDLRFDIDWVFNTWKLQTYFEIINVYNHCNVAGYSYDVEYNLDSKEKVCQLPLLPSFGVQAEF